MSEPSVQIQTPRTATVEVLAAEVRVLMVGSRQITLSVYRQLDWARYNDILPFGRVNDGPRVRRRIYVVGRESWSGVLVRSMLDLPTRPQLDAIKDGTYPMPLPELIETWEKWAALPLIVLAGLK